MPTPIIFTLTNAGLNAALDADANGLTLSLTQIGIGSGKYTPAATRTALQTEIARYPLSGGDIEPNSKTLRFSAILESVTTQQAFEVGLFTSTGVLFAVASTTGTDPLILVTANIAFVGSFGLVVSEIPPGSVTVVTDPNAALAVALMAQHVAAANPHPQYAFAAQNTADHTNFTDQIQSVTQDLAAHIAAPNPHPQYAFAAQNTADHTNFTDQIQSVTQDLAAHIAAPNPHPQYALKTEINPRQLFRFVHNSGVPYDTSSGVASGSVAHTLEGVALDLGSCLTDFDPLYVEPMPDYVVDGITLGNNLNRKGYFLKFDGFIQFGSYAGQGDTGFAINAAKIRFFDESSTLILESPLTITLVGSGFPNNGVVGHVMYRVSNTFDVYDIRKTDGSVPTTLYTSLAVDGLSDSNGGGPDLQILAIEHFAIFCSY
jgi:hypothetical protein